MAEKTEKILSTGNFDAETHARLKEVATANRWSMAETIAFVTRLGIAKLEADKAADAECARIMSGGSQFDPLAKAASL